MLRRILKKVGFLSGNNKEKSKQYTPLNSSDIVVKDLKQNLSLLKTIFANCYDVVIREFKIGGLQQTAAFLVMIDGLADSKVVNESLLKCLMIDSYSTVSEWGINKNKIYAFAKERLLTVSGMKETENFEDVIDAVLSGNSAIFIDGSDTALIASSIGGERRNIDEPDTEAVVRGPREGFVESVRTNTAMLRRKIKNKNLRLEVLKIGKQTKTDVCIGYLETITNEKIVDEVKKRLLRIDIDSVLESGYIESFIEDAPLSLFPTVGNSEKPDIVAAKLLEGRVAIFVDGTPFVLTVPYLFIEAFQNSEDYYSRPFFATFVRLLRWMAFFISVLLPAFYVAISTFHQELLPAPLLISIAGAQEGTPFPLFIEAFMMQLIYEILREAGIRLPRPVGQAVSIVGALVIGEAAVSAGLIGAPMVIVVALTAISSFVVPSMSDINTLTRLLLIIFAGFSGLYGITLGVAGILTHLCSLRSFGVPYTSPIAPLNLPDMKDVFIRSPWWFMRTRPSILRAKQSVRLSDVQIPKPAEDDMNNQEG